MDIFLTGHRGFIGSYVREYLTSKGHNVLTLSNAYRLTADVCSSTIFKKDIESVDAIVHLAANPNGNAGIDAYKENVEMTYNLCENVPKNIPFIFASSTTVYGDNLWCKETEFHNLRPTSLYGLSKLACEDMIATLNKRYNRKSSFLRLCAVVGPNMTHGVVKDIILKLERNREITLFGKRPGTCKQFIHVDVVAKSISYCLENQDTLCLNVVPSGYPITVEEIANLAMEELKISKDIVWDESKVWAGDNPVLAADSSFIRELGLCNYTSESSIRRALNEYKSYQSK